ncbi:MAG: hypothetical protein COB59_00260 [Rhodospirillaceae bacterium]|nr:MAG: hypothetical protein COB59_00260 [Rhodospirillaceae bacterium]
MNARFLQNHIIWIFCAVVVMAGAVFFSFLVGRDMAQRYAPLVDAAMEIKLETTTAHLLLDESLSGERLAKLSDIIRHIDQATWYAQVMLNGGNNQEGTFLLLEEPELRGLVEKIIQKISLFRSLAEERWGKGIEFTTTDINHIAFHYTFEDLITTVDQIETVLQHTMQSRMQKFTILQLLLVIVVLVLGAITGVLFQQNKKKLQDARSEAELANKAKSAFLASISHDLRTPLNAIMGFSELMKSEMFGALGDPHYVEYASDIRDSGEVLLTLIDDILDLSRIEAGKYILIEETVDLEDTIKASVKMLHGQADHKNIDLFDHVAPQLPHLHGDQKSVLRILNNLISNAIKFTPEGGEIVVQAMLSNDHRLKLQVKDTGIGVKKEDIAKALAPYEQIVCKDFDPHAGTGLGLFLCCSLVDLHGGEITFDSELGEGTTISILFPAERIIPRAINA